MMQVRELEEEVEALAVGKEHRRKLKELMNKKELVGDLFNNLRLTRQRLNNSARANSSTIAPAGNGSSSGHNSGSQSSSSSSGDSGESWQVSAAPSPCTVGLCTAVIHTMTLPGNGQRNPIGMNMHRAFLEAIMHSNLHAAPASHCVAPHACSMSLLSCPVPPDVLHAGAGGVHQPGSEAACGGG